MAAQKRNAPVLNKRKHSACRINILAIVVAINIFAVFSLWTAYHHHKNAVERTARTTAALRQEQEQSLRSPPKKKAATSQAKDDEEDTSVNFHFVVSSECSSYQLWETLTQMHSAEAVKQCGRFTWIISGCLPNDQLEKGKGRSGASSDILTPAVVQQHVDHHFPSHSAEDCSRLQPELHFTPDFSDMSVYGGKYADGKTTRKYTNPRNGKVTKSSYGNRYVFNNKPNGLLHWATEHEKEGDKADEAIVLVDPDFLFLSKFHLARPDFTVVGQKQLATRDRDLVSPGQPAAASYGLGAQWLDFDRATICGPDSHCTNATHGEVHKHYSAGPPYVIHRADVLRFAAKWASLVPPTYDEYPLLYAEMYAYSMAAAHLQLKHNLVNNLFTGCMVGWPNPDRWKAVDKDMLAAEKKAVQESAATYRAQFVTELQQQQQQQQQQSPPEEKPATSCFLPPIQPPPFLHYCNRYFMKTTPEMKAVEESADITYRFFAKRRMPHDTVLACDNDNSGGHRFLPFTSTQASEQMAGGNVDWNTLSVCAISRALNFARDRGCTRRQQQQSNSIQ